MKRCPVCTTPYPNSKITCDIDRVLLIESKELDPGTIINNKWEIVRTLGEGGMGIVYLARHIHTSRLRALKFLHPQISHDPKVLKRFRQEACIELRHPNIVQIFDSEQAEDGSPFIPMEYVDGSGLRELVGERTISVERALAITRDIALGLSEAHGRGILHRDIKPENILIANSPGSSETPKILDFGIAVVEDSVTNITRTRGLMFTPEYAAPEQWEGMTADEMDGRVDIYALGVVLFEMLTGRTDTRALKTDGRIYSNIDAPRLAPSRLRPEVAEWPGLDDLVLRMVAREREDRPENALDLAEDLEDLLRRIPPRPRKMRVVTLRESDLQEAIGAQLPTAISGTGETGSVGQVKVHLFEGYQDDHEQKASGKRVQYAVGALVVLALVVCAGYLGLNLWPKRASNPPLTPLTAELRVTCNLPCAWSLDDAPQGRLVPWDSVAPSNPRNTGEATVSLTHHTVVARPSDTRITAQSRSFDPRPSETTQIGFVFKAPPPIKAQSGISDTDKTKGTKPLPPSPRDPNEVPRLLQQAESLRQQGGDNAGAFAIYERVLLLDPGNSIASTKMTEIRNECDGACPGVR